MIPVKNPKRVAAGIKAAAARKRNVLMQVTSDDDITSDDKHVDTSDTHTNLLTQHKKNIIIGSAVLAVIATVFMWRTNSKPDDEQPHNTSHSVVIDPFEFN